MPAPGLPIATQRKLFSGLHRCSSRSLTKPSPQRSRALKGAGPAAISAHTLRVHNRNEGRFSSPESRFSLKLEGSPI